MSTLRRWTSEGGTPRRVPLRPSREGSVPAASREVRCACQFFQSDSYLPEPPSRPLSRTSDAVRTQSDHEYEPIGRPAESPGAGSGGAGGAREDDASSTTSQERQFLRPEEDNEAFSATDGEPEPDNDAMLLQKQIEDRYFVNTPTTTTESRTDCEISTSQVDSSALEDLPLKRENRKKSAVAVETAKLQQRIKSQTGKIKSQAGKLKTKLKTIKKPQFHMPERPKFERPKFNMPERPKFNMPERPKFNLPERPKFNFPDRPKINFPDKSKFRLPERPKINLPDRPKFNFPERPKFSMPDRSKFKLPDRPKLNFSTFNRNKEKNRPNDEETTESTSGTTPKKHNLLDFDFKTYPRFFSKMRKEKRDVAQRPGTPPPGFATVPRTARDRQQIVASHWDHASSRTDDEPRQYGLPLDYDKEPDFETKLAQVDKDYRQMQQENNENTATPRAVIENQEIWNKMERSAVQKLEHGSSLPQMPGSELNGAFDDIRVADDDDESSAASAGQHRRGVLEEIDNDEFFLRQKGISQDNIEVGKYLSDEIRDAFRSPINALSQMDSGNRYSRHDDVDDQIMDVDSQENLGYYRYKDDDDNDEHLGYDPDINHNESMAENDDGYYTFPPVRPSRAKKLKALDLNADKKSYDVTHIENIVQLQNVNLEEIPTPDIFPESKPFESENHIENVRKHVFTSSFKEPDVLENLNEYENEMEQTRDIPTIPKRRKKSSKEYNYSENGSITNDMFDRDEWIKPIPNEEKNDSNEIIVHRIEHIISNSPDTEEPPALPRRARTRSRGSRATSVGDDDRTSRGAESITLDSHNQLATVDLDFSDDLDDGPGYASVDKNLILKKIEPPPRPPAPMRRHRSAKSLSGDRQFFTVPRALKESTPPRRPLRNYSTLGPSRPPRKKSTTSLTTSEGDFKSNTAINLSSTDVTQYVEIEDEDQDTQKDLKSGEIVSKMKDRPLPPPPRPPRGPKKKREISDKKNEEDIVAVLSGEKDSDFLCDDNFENNNVVEIDTLQESYLHTDNVEDRDNNGAYEQEEVIEIEVSTQTDPLPDDFDYDLGLDEPLNDHFDCLPDTLPELTKEEKEEPEENSIDVEIFTKGLQKFRESSRPNSRASKVRTPIDRPKTPLGRMSPTAILVERRVSSPTRIHDRDELVTEASLTVQPIDEPFENEVETFIPLNRPYPTAPSPMYSQNWPTYTMAPSTASNIQTTPYGENDVPEPKQMILDDDERLEAESRAILTNHINNSGDVDVLRTRRLQVSDLDVERLNVSELQANKILVSEIEGLSLQISDINSKSGHIYVRGIELAPGVIEDILQKFAQMTPSVTETPRELSAIPKPDINQETQTEVAQSPVESESLVTEIVQFSMESEEPKIDTPQSDGVPKLEEVCQRIIAESNVSSIMPVVSSSPPPVPLSPSLVASLPPNVPSPPQVDTALPPVISASPPLLPSSPPLIQSSPPLETVSAEPLPERPPLPQIHPTMYPLAYYPEYSIPPGSFYRLRNPSERHHDDASEPELPSAPTRRRKHKREPVSSSDDEYRPVSRRAPPARPAGEPSVSELSAQLFRACQSSVSRSVRNILSYITSHFGGGEDKKDVQMALVIFLVMVAGLIMLGVGDGRTVHHHHWDFFNPPNNDK